MWGPDILTYFVDFALKLAKLVYALFSNKELCPSLVGLAYYGVTKGPTTEGLTKNFVPPW